LYDPPEIVTFVTAGFVNVIVVLVIAVTEYNAVEENSTISSTFTVPEIDVNVTGVPGTIVSAGRVTVPTISDIAVTLAAFAVVFAVLASAYATLYTLYVVFPVAGVVILVENVIDEAVTLDTVRITSLDRRTIHPCTIEPVTVVTMAVPATTL
jgi:hypothetical protein